MRKELFPTALLTRISIDHLLARSHTYKVQRTRCALFLTKIKFLRSKKHQLAIYLLDIDTLRA